MTTEPQATRTAARAAGSSSSTVRTRAFAVVGAVLAATVIRLIAGAAGVALTVDQHDGKGPVDVAIVNVIGFSLGVALLGWGVLALLEKFTPGRAKVIWTVLAVVVLLLSFAPLLDVGATSGTKITLALLHITVAAVLIPMLRRGAKSA